MERFKFVTSKGTIVFGSESGYVFTGHEGMNDGEVQRQESTYINIDGAEYSNPVYAPRFCTINGYIRAENDTHLQRLRAEMYRILNGKDSGILWYNINGRTYFAEAVPDLPKMSVPMQSKTSFAAFFHLPSFYWKNANTVKKDLYKRTDKISTPFMLPMVFTERTSGADAMNGGNVEAPCIIKIVCAGSAIERKDAEITIKNETSNEVIKLDYDIRSGEVITINTAEFTAESSMFGNILHKVRESSDFFKLKCGNNHISAVCSDTSRQISAYLSFNEMYIGV